MRTGATDRSSSPEVPGRAIGLCQALRRREDRRERKPQRTSGARSARRSGRSPPAPPSRSPRALAGLATGSLALISDAAHSLLDVASTTMTWLAVRAARQAGRRGAPVRPRQGRVARRAGRRRRSCSCSRAPSPSRACAACARAHRRRRPELGRRRRARRRHRRRRLALARPDEGRARDRQRGARGRRAPLLVRSRQLGPRARGARRGGARAIRRATRSSPSACRCSSPSPASASPGARSTRCSTPPRGPRRGGQARRSSGVPGVVAVERVRVRPAGGRDLRRDHGAGARAPCRSSRSPRSRSGHRRRRSRAELAAARVHRHRRADAARRRDGARARHADRRAAPRPRPPRHRAGRSAGRLSVSLDLEVDGRMTLRAAHAVADGLEAAIRDEFGPDDRGRDPYRAAARRPRWQGEDAEPALSRSDRPRACRARRARSRDVSGVHSVRVRETEAGLVVNYHCRVRPGPDGADVSTPASTSSSAASRRASRDPAPDRPRRAARLSPCTEARRALRPPSAPRALERSGLLEGSEPPMRTDTPPVIRLEDYRPSDFLIDRVELDIRLHPTRDAGHRDAGAAPEPRRPPRRAARPRRRRAHPPRRIPRRPAAGRGRPRRDSPNRSPCSSPRAGPSRCRSRRRSIRPPTPS